jgi:hypothetical protein
MSLLSSVNNQPKPLRYFLWAFIIGLPALSLLAIIYDLSMGKGYRGAEYREKRIDIIDLCPSIKAEKKAEFIESKEQYHKLTNCVIAPMMESECVGPPEIGHMQIRDCSDKQTDVFRDKIIYDVTCPPNIVDTVAFHPFLRGTGVSYIDQTKSINVVHHTLGHIAGLGIKKEGEEDNHSTNETSVMYPVPGHSFHDVDCTVPGTDENEEITHD